jgi:tRNA modification GTPase
MSDRDTIVAVATPPGRGGIGVVRVSGPACRDLARTLCGELPEPRLARLCRFRLRGEVIDEGIALFFPGPHSFTGEDVLELQGHGGPVVMDMLTEAVLELGARLARPGEFSERAFLNDKLDLAQAEAIADLIDSGSRQASRSALRSLQGEFSRRVNAIVEDLTRLRVYVEAAIDFPEEEIDFLSDSRVDEGLGALLDRLGALRAETRQGCVLREGLHVVIAGRPNAGKSSLMNALSGQDRAIVTDVPGTTRDTLHQDLQIDGLPVRLIDTAGLRQTTDVVESEGIRRARQEVASADCLLLVIDASERLPDPDEEVQTLFPDLADALPPVTVLYNKIDLSPSDPPPREDASDHPTLRLSAKTGTGIPALREHLKARAGYQASATGTFTARRRHLDALERAERSIRHGAEQLAAHGAGELLAEDLRQAQQQLGEITGTVSSDQLLGEIFSSFCIGK